MIKRRIQYSLGACQFNPGTQDEIKENVYVLDMTRSFYVLDVVPMGAPRMTQSDRWKTNPNHTDPRKRQRDVVTRYFAFKNLIVLQCNTLGFNMPNCIDVLFLIPMPDSWSKKKKEKHNGMPHKSKPDTDNIVKGLMDALKKEDSDVWKIKAEKRWAYKGSIIIFN